MPKGEYRWFMQHGQHARCVMGNDYYASNERLLQHDGTECHVGEVFGWYLVTREYYDLDRRLRPVGEAYRALIQEFGALTLLPHNDYLGLR